MTYKLPLPVKLLIGAVVGALAGLAGLGVFATEKAVADSPANTDPHNGTVVKLGHQPSADTSGVSKWCDGANLIYTSPANEYGAFGIAVIADSKECK